MIKSSLHSSTDKYSHRMEMSSSDSYSVEILHNFILYMHRYALPTFYILGNIGNFFNLLVLSKKSWRKNVCVFYFIVCHIFDLCYINSSMLEDILYSRDIILYDSSVVLCKVYFYVAYLFTTLTPSILICASIDRLLISSQNVDTRLYSSRRLAYFSVGLSTSIWFVLFFHLLIKMNIQQISSSQFICFYDLSDSYLRFVSYSTLIFNCLFSLTMIVFCVIALKNVRQIRTIPRDQRKQRRTMTKKDFQLLRCLFVLDIVYIIFTFPLNIFTVYKVATIQQTRTSLEQAIYDFFDHLSEFLHHSPYCLSFYIFLLVSKAFRNEIKRMIYKICGKNTAIIRDEENKTENDPRSNIELNVAVVRQIED